MRIPKGIKSMLATLCSMPAATKAVIGGHIKTAFEIPSVLDRLK
jgi:hypothetical protein